MRQKAEAFDPRCSPDPNCTHPCSVQWPAEGLTSTDWQLAHEKQHLRGRCSTSVFKKSDRLSVIFRRNESVLSVVSIKRRKTVNVRTRVASLKQLTSVCVCVCVCVCDCMSVFLKENIPGSIHTVLLLVNKDSSLRQDKAAAEQLTQVNTSMA